MAISKWDFMKLAEGYDSEINFADFSEEELSELLAFCPAETQERIRERYFAEHDDVKDRTLSRHKWGEG